MEYLVVRCLGRLGREVPIDRVLKFWLTDLPGNPSDFPGTDPAPETNNARVKRLLRWFRPMIPRCQC
jgi:hypothetical protein